MDISPDQIRAARALLRLEQAELARRAQVSVMTIRRLEGAEGRGRVTQPIVQGVRRALEAAGAEFIPDGVRRRRASQLDAEALYEDLRRISLDSAARLQGSNQLTEDDLYDADGLPA
jgi:transcriptional regulator with XRE-family HTH domain